jgi:heme exporter protein D
MRLQRVKTKRLCLTQIRKNDMHWNSISEFLAMGGYALYVWGSFGITFLAMAIEVWLLNKRRKQ